MEATPEVGGDATHGLTYGRRKCVPLFLAAAALATYWTLTARYTATRIIEVVAVVWFLARAYQFWTDPTPRTSGGPGPGLSGFGRKRWHKVVLAIFVALLAFLVLVPLLAKLHPRSGCGQC